MNVVNYPDWTYPDRKEIKGQQQKEKHFKCPPPPPPPPRFTSDKDRFDPPTLFSWGSS